MNQIKKLAGQTVVYGLSSIGGRFLNYLLVPILTRVFTQTEFGINVEFYAYISFFNIILTHGMETSFFRFAQKDNSMSVFANALISVVGATLGFLIIFLFAGNFISNAIGFGSHPEYLWYSVFILAFDALSAIPFALLRQQNKGLRFALIKNANILINVALTLYFLVLCPFWQRQYHTLLPFFYGHIEISYVFAANLFASIVTSCLLYKELLFIKLGFDKTLWRKMFAYALPMLFVGFAGMINETLDRVLLRYLWPDKAQAIAMNGIYGANYKLSILITLFIQAFKYAAEPFFFSHAKISDKREIYADVMNYFVLICLFIFLLVMLFINFFKDFIGPSFQEGLHVVPILLMANIFLGIYYNISIWYKLSDQTNKGAVISLIGAIITIVLNVILIPKMGYTGCAYATLICYFMMMIIGYMWGQKVYPIPYKTIKLALYGILAMFIFTLNILIKKYVEPNSVADILIHIVLLLIFAGVGIFAERKSIKLFIKQ
ncbi:MAG: oligosaccharide flippase family protein [Bacteroidia bacterium]|nr:oligosaccharide flippase family protein [Bacteroidia bacterium]